MFRNNAQGHWVLLRLLVMYTNNSHPSVQLFYSNLIW